MVQHMSSDSACIRELRCQKLRPTKYLGLGRPDKLRTTVESCSQIDIVNQWVRPPSVVKQSNELVKLREYLQQCRI